MKKKNKYDLSILVKTFERHSVRFRGNSSPNEEDLDFNLPMALCEICKEIESLKSRLDRLFKDGV